MIHPQRLCAQTNRTSAIPKGAWRLQLLSDHPLFPLDLGKSEGGDASDPSPASPRAGSSSAPGDGEAGEGKGGGGGGSTTVLPCNKRVVYGGDYVPNKYLYLFR